MRLWDPGAIAGYTSRLRLYLKLVRIEHTLFSLPFALIGLLTSGCRRIDVYVYAMLALTGLRSAALAFNNLADVDIDALNPRTRNRPLVAGLVSARDALMVIIIGILVYLVASYMISPIVFMLSPIPLVMALTYPYAKRVHPLPHLHLGFVLGLSVWGGWVAGTVTRVSQVALNKLVIDAPWALILGVAFWVAGFDIVYATLDETFDKEYGIGSLPALIGSRTAIAVAIFFETMAALLLAIGSSVYGVYALASSLAGGLLAVAAPTLLALNKISVSRAFNVNLVVGFVVLLGFLPLAFGG